MPADPADIAACRDLLRGGSRSFHFASYLLPAEARNSASALYAFCRVADDAIDLTDDVDRALDGLRLRLERIYDDRPIDSPFDRAFAATAARFAIPKAVPAALLEGFAWDAEGRRYETISEARAYAARVGSTVGAMMTAVMGVRSQEALARACDLGVAMQLTNIARDVGEDARAGRVYLPLDWMRDAGLDPDRFLAQPKFSDALGSVIARLLDEAARLYERSRPGIAFLPGGCRFGIHAALLFYCEIGEKLRRDGLDSVSRRSVVPGRRKLWLAMRSLGPLGAADGGDESCLDETRFLVDALACGSTPAARTAGRSRRRPRERQAWTMALLHKLERRERARSLKRRRRARNLA